MVTSDTETFLKKEKKIGVIIIANAIKKKQKKANEDRRNY